MTTIEIIQPIPRQDPIPLIERDELVEGGPEGAANRQAIALANNLAFVQERTYSKTDIDDSIQIVSDDLDKTKTDFNVALAGLSINANAWRPTLAAANADISSFQINQTVWVGDLETGGLYYKETSSASIFTPSPNDPIKVSKTYTDNKASIIEKSKQVKIIPDNSISIDFSSYLQVGSINATTGILENSNYANRRSIVNLPVEQGKYYNLQNLTDTVSNLRGAWFNALGKLISVFMLADGAAKSWIFTPPQNAAKLNIGLKSGSTDSNKFQAELVNLYKSDSPIKISKIDGIELNDPRMAAAAQTIEQIESDRKPDNVIFSAWLSNGVGSDGGINANTLESHLDYIKVDQGDVLTSDINPMYRINLYDTSGKFISQGGFTGGNTYTVPSGVAFVRISMNIAQNVNNSKVTITPKKSKITKSYEISLENSEKIKEKQDYIKGSQIKILNFDSFLSNGNINSVTGLLENPEKLSRRSIVNFPVERGKYYNLQNLADTASNLYISFFDSSGTLINIIMLNPGLMSDLTFTPPQNAVKVNIGLKSGNTDGLKYDASKVKFYESLTDFKIDSINGFKLKDSDSDSAVKILKNYVIGKPDTFSAWLSNGVGSDGGINANTLESHLDYIEVDQGDVLTSDINPMYRINLYDASKNFISQGGFTGGNTYTVPSGVAFVRVSMSKSYLANIATVKLKINSSKVDKALELGENAQPFINPEGAAAIDFSSFVQVGNISVTTGLLEGSNYANRRSIVNFPVEQGKYYNLQNLADTASNLRVSWFDYSNNLLSIVTLAAGTAKSWNFTPPQNAVKVNIGLKSGNTDGLKYDASKVKFFSSNTELKIKSINGFEIAGLNSGPVSDPEAVKQIIVGGTLAKKEGNTVTIDSATVQKSGLMSAADKIKLDSLVNGDITINGSGITKNAASFGFLPTKNAAENVAALKNAVAGGGTIIIDYPGVYDVNETVPLESNTEIIVGEKVHINKVLFNGKSPRYTFINRGAYTREWDENIIIRGLKIKCNGIGNGGDGTPSIPGLRGHIAMFYIKNLHIDNFELLDGDAHSYVIHVCTFENIKITGPYIEGYKDAIHLGNGKTFLIRDGQFRTYDDPIALNAHDYATGQPELGWIENGLIENCYDLDDPIRGTTGYFARILAGAWVDWFEGMEVQQSDTVVANGRMYRVSNGVTDPTTYYISRTEPSHSSGTVEIDGIKWTMQQESGITHTVGVRNVKFKDIFLQKNRSEALSIHFDTGRFSRSYYPNAEIPVQENITFEGLHIQAEIPTLVSAITPLKNLKIINSEIGESKIRLKNVNTVGMDYMPLNVLMFGNTFTGLNAHNLVECDAGRTARVKILGSIKENDSYIPTFTSGVTVLQSDL